MELSKFCEIMGVNMAEPLTKEIIIKAVKAKDGKIGPMLGICDREGTWYNTKKKDWDRLPGAWDTLTALKGGERLMLTYEERSWTSKETGKSGVSKDIVGFDPIIQAKDEVVPPPNLPRETLAQISAPPAATCQSLVQDLMPKMSCLRAAAEVVTALIGAGQVPDNPTEEVCLKARALYLDLTGNW